MLDPDKELQLLEDEFPRSRRAWTRETPAELDHRILTRAAERAIYLEAEAKREQRYLKDTLENYSQRWEPPAAGAPASASESEAPPERQMRFSAAFMGEAADAQPGGAEAEIRALRNAYPAQWRERLAQLLLEGELETVSALIEAYRQRFPNK